MMAPTSSSSSSPFDRLSRLAHAVGLALLAWAAVASPLHGAEPELAIPPGEVLPSEQPGRFSEAFAVPLEVAAALLAGGVGEPIRLSAFPVAPGRREALELRRYEVYAPGARVRVIDASGEREVPRSPRPQYLGAASLDARVRVGLSVDPETGFVRGLVDGPLGRFWVQEPEAGSSRHLLVDSEEPQRAAGVRLEETCGSEALPLPDSLDGLTLRVPGGAEGPETVLGGPTHTAVIAVDTDMELLDEKFSNNTTNASGWIADLFTAMNVAYERDVGLRLLQGETFLRPGSPPYTGDPWSVTGSPASSAHLSEFGTYWAANNGGVDRVLAMLLSGKSSSSNSASGIAWIDGYCESQSSGGGYSINQVFTGNFSSATLVAHELGHNFGSPHTHCYVPPVDLCYNAQGGCYAGPVSCPGGPGTTMSYCHFSPPNGAGCGQNQLVFHPTVAALFTTLITLHTPGCVEPTLGEQIFADGFESGNVSAWM